MKTIKITINGSHKIKLKTGLKKAKDVKLNVPDQFLNDTITFFKSPTSLELSERNVEFLSGLCEKYSGLVDVKPVFLKRVEEVQKEIERVIREGQGRSDEKGNENQQANQNRVDGNLNQEDLPLTSQPMANLNDTSDSFSLDDLNLNESLDETMATLELMTDLDRAMSQIEADMDQYGDRNRALNSQQFSTEDQLLDNQALPSSTYQHSHDSSSTLAIQDATLRTLHLRTLGCEVSQDLFLKIISPKQKVVTKYKAYNLSVAMTS